ncbi:polyketide cyclase [Streptomyces sp. NPDC000931]|uniref:polyketide cyclase n=1 Tax=Streptomyces sp. NPDC000931 TaxID=3154372 RepID=UPI0033215F5B
MHAFEARGRRVSLTCDPPCADGGSSPHTAACHGRFARLVPGEPVVGLGFGTEAPGSRGTMTITTPLTEAGGGTDVLIVHEGVPDAVPAAGNGAGTRSAPARPARFVEANA